MSERASTKGRWAARQVDGWGRDLCIVDADGAVIFRPVKPKAYYTDYAPGLKPGSFLLSDEIAQKLGRYVATPEIKAAINAEEAERAIMAAAAPDMFEALLTALPYIECAEEDDAYKPGVVAKVTAQIRVVLAKAGLTNLADATPKNPLSEGRERS